MAAGKPPFISTNLTELTNSILHQKHSSVAGHSSVQKVLKENRSVFGIQ
jgi:hypothetical protein